mgnify:FL=1
MILYKGKILENKYQKELLDSLYQDCLTTLQDKKPLSIRKVILACDAIYQKAIQGEYDEIALPLLKMADISYERFLEMAKLFSKEGLEYKCKIELGENYDSLQPLKEGTKRYRSPLGILFHIAAGNVDGLPAYSVVEGLLAGNINILKLPTGDSGLSIKLLNELILTEPELKDYIYVFDVPSTEIDTLQVFADIADGIVVWGGDLAVDAARRMGGVTTKIIPWGHKLSFAYATLEATDQQLYELAVHICKTNQVLCSSCQGIFIDTEEGFEQEEFANRFFTQFLKANQDCRKADLGMRGKNMIQIYNEKLENPNKKILCKDGISIFLEDDAELTLSMMFRNVWIKRLSRKNILTLKKHKNHLQTCALLCGEQDVEELSRILATAGVVRITKGDMARMYNGEAHDGVYPLQEYTRIVEVDV